MRYRQGRHYFRPHFTEKKLRFLEGKIALIKFRAEAKTRFNIANMKFYPFLK